MHVTDPIERPRHQGHGDDGRAGAVLYNGLCLRWINPVLQEVHCYTVRGQHVSVWSPCETAQGILATWHCFDVVGWVRAHHLGIDVNAIVAIRVESLWQLHEWQWGRIVGIEVVPHRTRALEHVLVVTGCHCGADWSAADA